MNSRAAQSRNDEPADSRRSWYLNVNGYEWRCAPRPHQPRQFHRSLPGYEPTPLVDMPDLAVELGIGRLLIKDESNRLGLPAFKILGASWAICRAVSARLGVDAGTATLDLLRERLKSQAPLTLVTATDGNHGRAVARMAHLLEVDARIYTPQGVNRAALDGIRGEGAQLIEVDQPYDDVVITAAESITGNPNDLLIQDTSWDGYEEIPGWIVDGYGTMLDEVDDQLAHHDSHRPGVTQVIVPVGVGSLAQAVLQHYRSASTLAPRVISVEPATADCVLQSLLAGTAISIKTSETIMTGLNCGTPSQLAWPCLFAGLDAATAVTDAEALPAVRDLHRAGVRSGPCAAAGLAALRAIAAADLGEQLGLGPDSSVVLIGTEGFDANPVRL